MPGESHGERSLVGYSPWGRKESDTTERLHFTSKYIMRNAGLEEAEVGIKIAGRNINNFRYADGTTLTGERDKELKSLLMKVKEESEKLA